MKYQSLHPFMKSIISDLRKNGKIGTALNYEATLNSFTAFCHGADLPIKKINKEIISDYQQFLFSRNNSRNTVSFYMRILRAVFRRAIDVNLANPPHPFYNVYTGIPKTVKRAISIVDIRKISAADFSLNPPLDFARDIFMLSFFFRGMSLIDLAFLKKTDLKNGYISYRRHKTGTILNIKFTPEMQRIVSKHWIEDSPYLLPILSPGKESHADYRLRSFSLNRYIKKVGKTLDIAATLTFYVARHSWASAAKEAGIPLSVISEGMGHSSILTTQIYFASFDGNTIDQANKLIIDSL